ncbi:MAG: hypothetical protein H6Q60_1368 [Oscillospiraceae bacterium]|nr:hypothetical protein [Oscillospiraceae bacterium]
MHKRMMSLLLVFLLCLSCLTSALASSISVSGTYKSGVVTISGTGFTSGTSYTVRVVNKTDTSLVAMQQVQATSGGKISTTITTGQLTSSNTYVVYVNTTDGASVATDSSIDFTSSSSSSSHHSSGSGSSSGGSSSGGSSSDDDDDSVSVSKFKDISSTDWYYEAVKYVVDAGLMKGTGSTTFEPNISMTRAMFVTVLYRLAGEPDVTTSNSFTDVVSDSWYEDAVIWGSENGVINGIGDNQFDPDTAVTREQMASFMYRYAAYEDLDTEVGDDAGISGFDDSDSTSDWAVDSLLWSVDNGLIKGMGNSTLAPQDTATRAQVATILMRFIENLM